MKLDNNFYKRILDHINVGIYFVDNNRKITYWNNGAEKLTGYNSAEVMGKRCSDNIFVHVDNKGRNICKTRCPLEQAFNGNEYESELYLLHKNGYRLPVLVHGTPIRDVNNKIAGAIEIFIDNSSKIEDLSRIKKLERKTLVDHLTNVGNRRYTEMNLHLKINEFRRYGWSFGIIFVDIDDFKNVNDKYGHNTGDDVLVMLAKTISVNLRQFDFVGRWGGDEFVIILVNVDNKKLFNIAEKIRSLIAKSVLRVENKTVSVNVSIGAVLVKPKDTAPKLIKRADKLMYHSKKSGGNRVSIKI